MHFSWKLFIVATVISAIITAITVGIGIGLFFELQSNEIEAASNDFSSLTSFEIKTMSSAITSTVRSVYTIRSVFNMSSGRIHPYDTFLPFMENSQSGIPGTYSLGWISRVNRNQRDRVINETRQYGRDYASFDFKIRNSTGQLTSAPVADVYYILTHVYPLGPNLGVLGFDLFVEPVRKNAIERSLLTSRDAVTSRIFLPHTKYMQPGVLYISPLKNSTGYLDGFGVGVFIIGEMFKDSAESMFDLATIVVFDKGHVNDNNTRISNIWKDTNYTSANFLWTNEGEYGPSFGSVEHLRYLQYLSDRSTFQNLYTLTIGDRYWHVLFIPRDRFLWKYYTGSKWIALFATIAGGFVISSLVYIVCVFLYLKWREMNRYHQLEMKLISENIEKTTNLLNRISKLDDTRKKIFNNIPDVVVVVDEKGKVLYANNIFYTITSLKDIHIREGTYVHTLFPDLSVSFYTSAYDSFREATLKPFFGKSIPVLLTAFSIDISPKYFTGEITDDIIPDDKVYVIIVRDLSHSKALLTELQGNKNRIQILLKESEFERRWNADSDGEFKGKLLQICKRNKNEENIYFLQDVERYKNMQRYDQRVYEQERLINLYIRESGERQLNITNDLRLDVLDKAVKDIGDPAVFDNIYANIKLSVATETYNILKKEESNKLL